MKEYADPFGLPVLAGDAASWSAGVRREVASGRNRNASASARGRMGVAG